MRKIIDRHRISTGQATIYMESFPHCQKLLRSLLFRQKKKKEKKEEKEKKELRRFVFAVDFSSPAQIQSSFICQHRTSTFESLSDLMNN